MKNTKTMIIVILRVLTLARPRKPIDDLRILSANIFSFFTAVCIFWQLTYEARRLKSDFLKHTLKTISPSHPTSNYFWLRWTVDEMVESVTQCLADLAKNFRNIVLQEIFGIQSIKKCDWFNYIWSK